MPVVVLLLVFAMSAAVPALDSQSKVDQIFAAIEQSNPTAASRAATSQQLAKLAPNDNDDSQVKDAFALALIHEHRYGEALAIINSLLKSEPKYVPAHRLRAWLLITLHKNVDALAELESLAKLLPAHDLEGDEELPYLEAAQFIGTVVGFFDGPGETLVKEPVRTKYKSRILVLLTSNRREAFNEQCQSVAKRFAELRASGEQVADKKVEKKKEDVATVQTKQSELSKSRTEVKEQAEKTAQELRDEWKKCSDDLTAAQNTYIQLSTQTTMLQGQLQQAQSRLFALQNLATDSSGNIPASARNAFYRHAPQLRTTIDSLQNQLVTTNAGMAQVVQRGLGIENRMGQLATEGERVGENFALGDQIFGKQAKVLAVQEKRFGKALEKTIAKKPKADTQLREFHSYDDFSFDAEKQRILSAMADRQSTAGAERR